MCRMPCPASPSPVCSPVTTSPALSPHQINGSRSVRCRGNRQYADSSTEGSIVLYNGNQSRGKEPLEASAGVAGTGPSSARSDNASIGVLPANLSSNRESKPISENPEEENDGVRDIHVTLERTRAAAASNETRRSAQRRQHNWSDTSMGSFVSSDTESISLSTEFNNVLAAAAAATSNSSAQALDSTSLINLLNENSSARSPAMRSTRLPGIGEEEPTRSTSEEAGDRNEGDANNGNGRRDNMALVPTSTTAAEGNREQRNAGRDYFALVPIDGAPESTGSTSDRDAPQSSWDAQHNEGAIVESGNANGDNTDNRGFGSSTSSIRSGNENRLPTPKQLALQKEVTLQKVKKDKIEAKAVAWEEAKLAKVDNRFKREETIIEAWENEQKVKANIKMKKVERKLEEKRATAFEKMQNEIAKSHRKAENRRAVAEARRGSAKAKIAEVADKIRSLGKLPRKFIFF